MSVGELINLYRDEDLDIHPEFQRFFRWSAKQKSRFIESLLLGIPIPSIFVYQRHDGVWGVIDGLQRLSTIFEFVDILRDEAHAEIPASTLVGTEYLPALEGLAWESTDSAPALDPQQQRLIKRTAIDVKIVRRESDEATKFDLFQRLNTGGSQLSDQEARNCLLIMADPAYYRWLLDLRNDANFQTRIAISDRAASEQYDMELALRFLLLKDLDDAGLRTVGDMSDFLDKESVRQAQASGHRDQQARQDFEQTFAIINDAVGDSAFRRYDDTKHKFMGGFSVSAFESVTTGVHANLAAWTAVPPGDRAQKLTNLISEIWSDPEFRDNSGSGIRASTRLPRTIPYARRLPALKLRTLSEFEDAVARETAWRRRELTTLRFNVRDARTSKQQVSLRAGLAMLYAHWEGWIKAVGEIYVEYVNQQGLTYSAMSAPFLGNALKTQLAEVEEANTAAVHTRFAEFVLTGGLEKKARLSSKLVRTESDLSSKVLQDIAARLGIPFDPYELLAPLIDERLVGARNTIAHGEYLELDEDQYEELHVKVLQMLNTFTTDVLVAARTRAFAPSA